MRKQISAMLLTGSLLLCGCQTAAVLPDTGSAETGVQQTAEISLWDTQPTAVMTYLNGTQYKAIQTEKDIWINCSDLQAAYDAQYSVEDERLLINDTQGNQAELTCWQLHSLDDCDTAAVLLNEDGSAAEAWISVSALTEQLCYRSLRDEANQSVYISPKTAVEKIPTGKQVPVLMYHAVSDETWGLDGLFMSPDSMREQLEYLTENGYEPIFFSDLTHLEDYDKPVILTFDDGYADNYSELFPLLQEFQVKATIFVITDVVDVNPKFMTSEQIRELSDSGLVDIESHTAAHNELASLSAQEQDTQMSSSQLAIARMTGRIPYVLSYPSGKYNEDTLNDAGKYYDFAVKSRGNLWTTADNTFFEIDRYPVYRNVTLAQFETFVQGN